MLARGHSRAHTAIVTDKSSDNTVETGAANGHRFEGCSHPGCTQPGDYPAPRSPDALRDYIWLCLEHVRDYNKAWNYYAGMDESEIEKQIRDDVTWRRPTWPLGARGGAKGGYGPEIQDDFGVYQGSPGPGAGSRNGNGHANGHDPASQPEREALATMELSLPVSQEQVRARYKQLVKRLHPDANGGDKQAEERLKLVTQAYATLKSSPHVR